MGDNIVNDAEIRVLVERMNNYLDGQKRIEGQLSMVVNMQLSIASQQEQIKGLESGQKRLFDKSDELDGALKPLRDEMIGNRRAVRMASAIGAVVIAAAGALYSQWKPWADDLARAKESRDQQISKWQFDIGQELRRDDNRLTVLEFRANNIDSKGVK